MTTFRLLPRVALCAAACTALASAGVAHAGPSQADLARIRLYGEVSIAQDSVHSWGVWEQFEPPAAGPAPLSVALPSRGELYRPLAPVIVTPITPLPPVDIAGLCASGALCGIGLFSDAVFSASVAAAAAPVAMATPVTPERFAFVTRPEVVSSPELPQSARLAPQVVAPLLWEPDAMRMRNEALNGGQLEADSGVMHRDGSYYGYDKNGTRILTSDRQGADDGSGITDEVAVARLSGIYSYMSGESTNNLRLVGYWGVTTPAAGMAELVRGNVVATYTGRTDGVDVKGLQQAVTMTIDFGQSKITAGQFGAGVDGTVVRSRTPSGTQQLSGQVGFTFTGDVVGSSFRATNLQAADATAIRGTVQGAFFGASAQVAAGVADVVKSKAVEGGYTNARYTDTFITYKVDPSKR